MPRHAAWGGRTSDPSRSRAFSEEGTPFLLQRRGLDLLAQRRERQRPPTIGRCRPVRTSVPARRVAGADQRVAHEARAHLLTGRQALNRGECTQRPDDVIQEAAAAAGTDVEQQVRQAIETVACESSMVVMDTFADWDRRVIVRMSMTRPISSVCMATSATPAVTPATISLSASASTGRSKTSPPWSSAHRPGRISCPPDRGGLQSRGYAGRCRLLEQLSPSRRLPEDCQPGADRKRHCPRAHTRRRAGPIHSRWSPGNVAASHCVWPSTDRPMTAPMGKPPKWTVARSWTARDCTSSP